MGKPKVAPRTIDELRGVPESDWTALEVDRKERWCPSCRLRFAMGPPPQRDFHQISMHATTFGYLLAAAREFDETAEHLTPHEAFTAVDFLDWIFPTLVTGKDQAA